MKHQHPDSAFQLNDANYLPLENQLAKHRCWAEDVWVRRVCFSLCLGKSAHTPNEKKYRCGIFCYLAWLYWYLHNASADRDVAKIPDADYLIYIVGNVSIEVDTLVPIARALHDSGQSVVVVFGGGLTPDVSALLHNIPLVAVTGDCIFCTLNGSLTRAVAQSIWTMTKAFVCLIPLRGCLEAFWNRGVWQLHNLLHFFAAELFWERVLHNKTFQGVAVASEFAISAAALCKVAKRNSWSSHHFLHGLPSIQETRGIATHVYCYSQADCDFFLQNNWDDGTVHSLGHPRQCALSQRIRKGGTGEPCPAGLRLLFASGPPSPGGFGKEEYELTLRAVMGAARGLSLTSDEFRLRLHPAEPKELFTDALGLECPDQFFSTRNISEDLAWANVIMTVYSTMAIEAAYADSLLIWLGLGDFMYQIREDLAARGYGIKVTTADDLRETLSACRDPDYLAERLQQQQRAARDQHILNPLAASDSAALMITAPRRHALPSCPNR